jgi:hypothetical protein
MAGELQNLETFRRTDELLRTFRTAVRKAQEESRRLGVPNVYWINGRRYFELPNGELTETDPWEERDGASNGG